MYVVRPFYFSENTYSWEQRKLKEISEKIIEKNVNNDISETFTNSAEFGVISQRDFFDKDIANANNLNGYYIVKNDDFIYNPRISNFAPVGPIKRNKLGKTGVMSPLYYVFRTHGVDCQFLETYFETTRWHEFMKLNGDTGARADRFSIKDSVFCEMPIFFPCLKEQTAIGNFFKQLDETIALHQRQTEKYQKLKIGFLESVFCTNLSTNNSKKTNDWEQRKLGEIGASFYGGGTPNTAIDDFWNGHLAWLQSSDISEFDVLHSNPKKFITLKGLQNSAAKKIPSKSIAIVTRVGVGKVLLVPFEYSTSQDFLSISELKIDELFAIYAISKLMNIEKDNVQGTSIKGITKNELLDQSIFIPKDKTEQTAIGNFFKQLDETIALHQRQIEKYRLIKKLFLEKMFIK